MTLLINDLTEPRNYRYVADIAGIKIYGYNTILNSAEHQQNGEVANSAELGRPTAGNPQRMVF